MNDNYQKLTLILFLVFFNLLVNAKIPKKLNGGKMAFIINHPSTVSILYRGHHLCTGNIINDYEILTTASCVTSEIGVVYSNLKIYSGTSQLNLEVLNDLLNDVDLIIYHKDYMPRTFFANDIAILRLTNRLVLSQSRQALSMTNVNNIYHEKRGTVVGWGKLADYNFIHLKTIGIKFISQPYCSNKIHHKLHDTQKCFRPLTDTSTVTQGDGGSRVTINNFNNLLGIVSLTSVFVTYQMSIFTSIDHYRDWINEIKL